MRSYDRRLSSDEHHSNTFSLLHAMARLLLLAAVATVGVHAGGGLAPGAPQPGATLPLRCSPLAAQLSAWLSPWPGLRRAEAPTVLNYPTPDGRVGQAAEWAACLHLGPG